MELAPAAPEGFAGLGRVLLALADPEGAARELRRALDLDPGFAMAHFLLGTALRRLGRADEAQREFVLGTGSKQRYLPDEVSGELLSLTIGVAPLLTNAQSRIEAGRVEEAIGMLESALAERPDNVSLLNQLSLAYKHNQELERALHALMRARELEPDAIKANVNLAETLIALGRWDTALGYADRCTVLAPSYGKGHFARGRALMFLQRFPEAYVALVSAIGFDRTNPHINIALGEACVRLGKFPEAAENFADAAQRLPDFLPVQVNSCMISLRLGNLSQAETALRAARRLAPDHPQVRQMASQVARARKL